MNIKHIKILNVCVSREHFCYIILFVKMLKSREIGDYNRLL